MPPRGHVRRWVTALDLGGVIPGGAMIGVVVEVAVEGRPGRLRPRIAPAGKIAAMHVSVRVAEKMTANAKAARPQFPFVGTARADHAVSNVGTRGVYRSREAGAREDHAWLGAS